MKRIQLYMAALAFAQAQTEETNLVTLAENSLTAFKAGGFDPEDFNIWNGYGQAARQQFVQMAAQKLPSEITAAQVAAKAAAAEAAAKATPAAPVPVNAPVSP